MSLPDVVSHEAWVAARTALLAQEKELTRARDALAAARRQLPMVLVEKDYRFEGPDGEVGLVDLFEGRHQLIVGHFMFDPSWEDGCPSCSAGAEEMSTGHLDHLHTRDTTFAYVSRAPFAQIEDYRRRRGWNVPGTPPTAATSITTSMSPSTRRWRPWNTTSVTRPPTANTG